MTGSANDSLYSPADWEAAAALRDARSSDVAAALASERTKGYARWLKWLADIRYGVDFTCSPPPPCELRDLAEVYAGRDGEPVEDWVQILLDGNTSGGWFGDGRTEP